MVRKGRMNIKPLYAILGIVVLLLLTVGGVVSCSPESETLEKLEAQGKLFWTGSGSFRLMMVLKFTPRPKPSYPEYFPTIPVPRASPTWDCDDDALYMYNYFKKTWCASEGREIFVVAVIGNLDIENEDVLKLESDHVWVILNMDERYWIAYDWGEPCFDDQHYEGCIITYEELLQAVECDKK